MLTKDSRAENMLTLFGAAWIYSNSVTWEDLIATWDNQNFGRSRVRVDAVIEEYHQRGKAGSAGPAVILRKTAKGLEVLDGVQRLCAERLMDATSFSAYIVETDSDILARTVRVMANKLLAGHPEPEDWNRKQAVSLLVIDGHMSCEEVARMGGWRLNDIEDERINLDWSFKIRCAGGPESLHKGMVLNIAKYAQQDDLTRKPVVKFLDAMKRGRFGNGESEPFIRDFFGVNRSNPKKLHEAFEQRLEKFHKEPEVQTRLEGRQTARKPAETKLTVAIKSTLTVTDEILASGTAITYMDEFFTLWGQVERNLKAIAKIKKAN